MTPRKLDIIENEACSAAVEDSPESCASAVFRLPPLMPNMVAKFGVRVPPELKKLLSEPETFC
jgi:hypothetical protein